MVMMASAVSTDTGAAGGSHVGRRRILKRHSDGDRDAVKTTGDLCDDHLDHLQLPLHILSWCLAALMAQPCLFSHQLLKLKDACQCHTPELLWCICVLMCLCISNNWNTECLSHLSAKTFAILMVARSCWNTSRCSSFPWWLWAVVFICITWWNDN